MAWAIVGSNGECNWHVEAENGTTAVFDHPASAESTAVELRQQWPATTYTVVECAAPSPKGGEGESR